MKVNELLKQRKSIRHYENKLISTEDLNLILDAAIISPSGKNNQPWEFVVVSGETKNKMADELANAMGRVNPTTIAMSECSHLILVYKTDLTDEYADISIGASIENMLLQATDLGLGSLWIGYIKKIEKYVNNLANETNELVSAVAIGYPGEVPPARPRKNKEDIVKFL